MKKLIVLALLALLSACDTCPRKPEVHPPVIIPEKETVVIPKSLLEACPDLKKFDKHEYTEGDTVEHLNSWVIAYGTCKAKQERLAGIIEKAFNTDVDGNKKLEKVK